MRTLQTDRIAVFMDEQLCRGAMHHQRDKEVSEMLWKVVGCWLLSFSSSHHGMDMFVVVALLSLLTWSHSNLPTSGTSVLPPLVVLVMKTQMSHKRQAHF
jgi:hypothetical protein